jgi:hypothetical protein
MLSKPTPVSKFPRTGQFDENGIAIHMRDVFNLPRNAKVNDYTHDILRAFPFLSRMPGYAGQLMFRESQIILEVMSRLAGAEHPIVTYPVHDCLICKRADEQEVVDTLQSVMSSELGASPTLEVEYSDQESKIIHATYTTYKVGFLSWYVDDDNDPLLIEDDT